jgi:hypothetical protein
MESRRGWCSAQKRAVPVCLIGKLLAGTMAGLLLSYLDPRAAQIPPDWALFIGLDGSNLLAMSRGERP